MQPRVDEIGRQILGERPFARGVGDDERDPPSPQRLDERLVDERLVTDLERVAQRATRAIREPCAALDLLVTPTRERGRRVGVARQLAEEIVEQRPIEAKRRR